MSQFPWFPLPTTTAALMRPATWMDVVISVFFEQVLLMSSLRVRNIAVLAVLLVIVGGVFILSFTHVPNEVRASQTVETDAVD